LPIADFFLESGHEVYWPIDSAFIHFVREAKPQVQFIPVDHSLQQGYFLEVPAKLLRQIEKYLVLKYDTHHTPTLINGWRYITGPG